VATDNATETVAVDRRDHVTVHRLDHGAMLVRLIDVAEVSRFWRLRLREPARDPLAPRRHQVPPDLVSEPGDAETVDPHHLAPRNDPQVVSRSRIRAALVPATEAADSLGDDTIAEH
jgi:hypothetical protein